MINNGIMDPSVTLTYAGEVFNGATAVPMSANNYSLTGNMAPVAFDIQRFVVNGDVGYGDIQILTINENAETDLNFVWIPESAVNPEDYPGLEQAGWFDEINWYAAEYEFQPGEGFMLNNGIMSDEISFKMPSALE